MNRESESYFRELPEVHIPRSKIIKEHNYKATWNIGDCVPIYVDEVLAGSTISMDMAAVMRMQTPLYPTMDNLYTDFLWFFCPFRLVWDHWVNMWGENDNAWYPQVEYEVPQITTDGVINSNPVGAIDKTLWDYMGLPTGVPNLSVSALYFRSYVKIWNDWMRSTPLQQEAPNTKTDSNATYDPLYAYKGGALLKANKMHDFFTSALPDSQYGPEITIPLGTVAPVQPLAEEITYNTNINSVMWRGVATSTTFDNTKQYVLRGRPSSTDTGLLSSTASSESTNTQTGLPAIYPSNLWADLSNASAATVATLRSALAIQHFYEAQARYGGGRYISFLRGIFGVVSPDGRLQRSEFLGGRRVPHNIATVVQTSSTDATSPQGNTTGFSHTVDKHDYFTKSFTEPGVLMCIMVTRYKHSYSQGIPEMFQRKKWTDFYVPQFNGISEVGIKNKTLYATGTNTDDEIFGYQEYGASYRYYPDTVVSELRPTYGQSLDAWHYGDYYNSLPVLGSAWIKEDRANVDRTLAVSSGLADQMLGDFFFKPTYVLPMPIYSVPGIDKI